MTPLYAAISRLVPVNRTTTYQNPVQPGDFPDPSIVRVGERDFYATTTSTDWAPEFPIFHSRDLVSWTLVGSVFATRPAWAVGNFWAPEFCEYNGRFYVYYVARRRNGPLCVAVASAAHPAGPYTDHGALVGQGDGSIDPMATVDEHGQRWLIWKEDGNSAGRPTPIWAQRLRPDGLAVFGDKHELIRNDAQWEGDVVEAPVIFRRDGWFYMLYSGNACCGADCAYAVGAARSRHLLGPWEKCPSNPILAGNDSFRCPGHGSVSVDALGRMYFLYHAYALAADSVYVGRQMLLDRVDWTSDGWPSINAGRGPSDVATTPFAQAQVRIAQTFFDDFTAVGLADGWQWPQGAPPQTAIDVRRGGHLMLTARALGTACDPLDAVLARPVTHGNYVATTAVDVRNLARDTVASLTAYGDRRNALGIGVRNNAVVIWRRKRGRITLMASNDIAGATTVHLRMTVAAGHNYRFAFSFDGKRWEDGARKVDGAHLPPWDRGVRIALTAGGSNGAQARFDFLRIRSTRKRVAEAVNRKSDFERHRLRLRRLAVPA